LEIIHANVILLQGASTYANFAAGTTLVFGHVFPPLPGPQIGLCTIIPPAGGCSQFRFRTKPVGFMIISW